MRCVCVFCGRDGFVSHHPSSHRPICHPLKITLICIFLWFCAMIYCVALQAKKLRVGPGIDPATDVGPVISVQVGLSFGSGLGSRLGLDLGRGLGLGLELNLGQASL